MSDDDNDEGSEYIGLYENGHWVWDNVTNELVFLSEKFQHVINFQKKSKMVDAARNVKFREDVDLLEQARFRRLYQRRLRPDEPDIIKLQDIKDLVIFTAPLDVMNSRLINFLHIPTTERYIRALIFYCQYYLQVVQQLDNRKEELLTKIRTPDCKIIEDEFRINLCDIKVLVAKEYCNMLVGAADTRCYHHLGPKKIRKSLPGKDAKFFESLIRVTVQIIWLAMGRNAFNKIELEVNRLFKSETFNMVEHTLNTRYINNMTAEEHDTLIGFCAKRNTKLNNNSPLMNEVTCHRSIDYRLLGLGDIDYPVLSPRLEFMMKLVSEPEERMVKAKLTLGIIGLPRGNFDTMLYPLTQSSAKSSAISVHKITSKASLTNRSNRFPSKNSALLKIFPDISIPPPDSKEPFYSQVFPAGKLCKRICNEVQRQRWQKRYNHFYRASSMKLNCSSTFGTTSQ